MPLCRSDGRATGALHPAHRRLPLTLPITLGLKDLLARRKRAFWLACAIAVTAAVFVATLSMQSALGVPIAGGVSDIPSELPVLVYTLDAVLVVVALTTLVAVTLLSVRERTRDFGVLKAIGVTPAQISASLVGAHAVLALVAASISIPLGIGLYLAVYALASGSIADAVIAPWWWLCLIPLATPVIVAITTSLPAGAATRTRIAEAIRCE